MAKFFLVCGESSGDRLGAIIGAELLQKDHEVIAWGGPYLKEAGVTIKEHIGVFKIMGWTDVIKKIPELARLLSKCKRDILKEKPDTLVLIDFGSFNLRIAKWAHQKGIRVIFYSPPKVWASRPRRLAKLKKYCADIIVLFPFEKEFFESNGVPVHYYGHPFLKEIIEFKKDPTFLNRHQLQQKDLCAILPGSRRSEINQILPIQLSAAKELNIPCFISCAPKMKQEIKQITERLQMTYPIIEKKEYYQGLSNASLALVTSGTATLETALFKIPQVVTYKTSILNHWLAKKLIKVPFISLPNLILNKEIVKELIQDECSKESIKSNLISLLEQNKREHISKHYNNLINVLNVKDGLSKTITTIIGNS